MRVVWSRLAWADKERIWQFLADRNIDYADKVELRIEARASMLQHFPRIGRPKRDSVTRELSVPDTQHVIVYRIEDEGIRIMRVWSTAQHRESLP